MKVQLIATNAPHAHSLPSYISTRWGERLDFPCNAEVVGGWLWWGGVERIENAPLEHRARAHARHAENNSQKLRHVCAGTPTLILKAIGRGVGLAPRTVVMTRLSRHARRAMAVRVQNEGGAAGECREEGAVR